MMKPFTVSFYVWITAISWTNKSTLAYSLSTFHGRSLALEPRCPSFHSKRCSLSMRKQKASDKRTTRLQRGLELATISENTSAIQSLQRTMTTSPMTDAAWDQKKVRNQFPPKAEKIAGRGRSRKRSSIYQCLSSYHNNFLTLLTAEYKAEVSTKTFCAIGKMLAMKIRIFWERFLPFRATLTMHLLFFNLMPRRTRYWDESRRPSRTQSV